MEQNKQTIYSNSVNLQMQVYDLRIEFATMHPDLSQEKVVNVFMSPQHAKAFSKILAEHIKVYEDTFGTIPDMPSPEKLAELQEKGTIAFTERALTK